MLIEKSKRWILKLFMITIHGVEKSRESAQRRMKPQLSMNKYHCEPFGSSN